MTNLQRRSWLLLSLAALGATGMFLGPDRWRGIDLGATGAALLYVALLLLAIHLSKHPEDAFLVDATPAERQAWVSVVFVTLLALHWMNFANMLPDLGTAADLISNPASRRFSINLGMLIVGWAVFAGVVRSGNRDTVELDERDLRIQSAASRTGSGVMAVLIVGTIAALATLPDLFAPWLRPLIVANALVGLLILVTLSENVFIVARYRREHA